MSQQSSNPAKYPSPSNVVYIEKETYEFIMDVLRPTRTDYRSPQHEFIRNEVLKDVERVIKSSIQPK